MLLATTCAWRPARPSASSATWRRNFPCTACFRSRQNLEFSAGVYGLEGHTKRERIDEMIEIFQLEPYLKVSPDSLPLGFKQRLAMACALMHRPPVLFLDEPTSGVDPITRREFWTHINGLVRKGVTVMVTTHFMDEAEYCDRVALMYQARLIALDTPDALKQMAVTSERPEPTMEDAFIHLVESEDSDDGDQTVIADSAANRNPDHAEGDVALRPPRTTGERTRSSGEDSIRVAWPPSCARKACSSCAIRPRS